MAGHSYSYMINATYIVHSTFQLLQGDYTSHSWLLLQNKLVDITFNCFVYLAIHITLFSYFITFKVLISPCQFFYS